MRPTSGIADDGDNNAPEGNATADLQSVLSYTGIYENWNVDVDGATDEDDPWHFGVASDYPVLKFGGMDPYRQYADGDYDRDDDGLIEIFNLERLNAVRWDLDGDGAQDSVSDADWLKYEKAFPAAAAGLGCPDTTADTDSAPGPREFLISLDFDASGNGCVGDADPYPNWDPIGYSANGYAADFAGNNNKLANMRIWRTADADDVGLFGRVASGGVITGAGLSDMDITSQGAGASLYIGSLAGYISGTARGVYATGVIY